MNCCTNCGHSQTPIVIQERRRGGGPLGFLLKTVVLYVLLLFGSGTLINTGQPVAVESGRLVQTLMFVEPTIRWTHQRGWDRISDAVQVLANGAPVPGASRHGA